MAKDEYGFDPEENYTVEDNPFWDGTPVAHPAWWRGQDNGVKAICTRIKEIFEEDDSAKRKILNFIEKYAVDNATAKELSFGSSYGSVVIAKIPD